MDSNDDRQPTRRRNDGVIAQLGSDRRIPIMRMDWSLNIPTVISMMTLAASVAVAGFTTYKELSDRQNETKFAVQAQAQKIEKLEANIDKLKLENTAKNTELRTEIKSDIGEIKGLLNEVIFGRGRPNQALKEWSK